MKIAYLIMAHANPQLLQRTIATLSIGDPDCGFFIHLDAKAPFPDFGSIQGQNVCFVKRISVFWGEFSQTEAILSLVRQSLENPVSYDYCVLITGACYPLRTGGYIRRFLDANRGLEYMDILRVPGPGKPLSRFETIRYPSTQPLLRFAFRALAKFGLARRAYRNHLGGLEPYSGDGAWALTREACQYVIDCMSANPRLEQFFRYTFASDEALFHTILGNSPFRSRMRRNLVYAVWPGPANGHPAIISEKDVDFFESREKVSRDDMYGPGELLFVRKLNDQTLMLVERIDRMITRKEGLVIPANAASVRN